VDKRVVSLLDGRSANCGHYSILQSAATYTTVFTTFAVPDERSVSPDRHAKTDPLQFVLAGGSQIHAWAISSTGKLRIMAYIFLLDRPICPSFTVMAQ